VKRGSREHMGRGAEKGGREPSDAAHSHTAGAALVRNSTNICQQQCKAARNRIVHTPASTSGDGGATLLRRDVASSSAKPAAMSCSACCAASTLCVHWAYLCSACGLMGEQDAQGRGLETHPCRGTCPACAHNTKGAAAALCATHAQRTPVQATSHTAVLSHPECRQCATSRQAQQRRHN
jgi:hypothetical protein